MPAVVRCDRCVLLRRKVTAGTANHGEHDALRFKTLEASVATNWFRMINESVGTYFYGILSHTMLHN